MTDFETLQQAILSDDWQRASNAAQYFAQVDSDQALAFLLPLLGSPSDHARDAAALALGALGDERAVEPLVAGLLNPVNPHNYGTLAFALSQLDSSHHFAELFRVTLTSGHDVQWHTLNMLLNNDFWITGEALETAQRQLDEARAQIEARPPDTHTTHAQSIHEKLQELLDQLASEPDESETSA